VKDFLRKAPCIHIITFSGAHSTGKSTLIDDVKKELENHDHLKVFTIPSCSSAWAKKNNIPKYEDINRLNLRKQMQSDLPSVTAGSAISGPIRSLSLGMDTKTWTKG